MANIDMNLGDTRLILSACMQQGLLRNQAAYVLATAYWETARTMEPVEEAFWVKNADQWREKNLRYYPWHGRGYVQLTWERNYHKASAEVGVDLTEDPNKAMQADIAAQVLVIGCRDGWFTGKRLDNYITLKASNFRGARRVVNGTDKAAAIAELAREYDKTLLEMSYGIEPSIPVVNDRLDGSAPRKNPTSSTTLWGALMGSGSIVAAAWQAYQGLPSDERMVVLFFTGSALLSLLWIGRERLRKWAEGDR